MVKIVFLLGELAGFVLLIAWVLAAIPRADGRPPLLPPEWGRRLPFAMRSPDDYAKDHGNRRPL